MELYGTLRLGEKFRNFVELFNVSYGTEQLWPEWEWSSRRRKSAMSLKQVNREVRPKVTIFRPIRAFDCRQNG